MIGVIAEAGQLEAVSEFFELFKTPWEIYRTGHWYDVVLTTGDLYPLDSPRLLIVFSKNELSIDSGIGCMVHELHDVGALFAASFEVPIYCGLRTLRGDADGISLVKGLDGTAVVQVDLPKGRVIRAGYDLFQEVALLLSKGQPIDKAQIPTLDIHIRMLRDWILSSGVPIVEIAPTPAGYEFAVCLTHDIDFIALRQHKLDRSFWGFAYRASIGSMLRVLRGRLSIRGLLKNWAAVASAPLVLAGWANDFWEPFAWYLDVEKGLPATYFLIPFKDRPGKHVPGNRPSLRGSPYAVSDLKGAVGSLLAHGCEVSVHGLDAWHDVESGVAERDVLGLLTGETQPGIRIHWLLRDLNTPLTLDSARFSYDSTFGYNETVGYRAGTAQVFRPLGVNSLLELPLHIQDGALFYPQRLDLTEAAAADRCQRMIAEVRKSGGVLTLLWHDRSHGPERLWGAFYRNLVTSLKESNLWFATGAQATAWFRQRRSVKFTNSEDPGKFQICRDPDASEIVPPLNLQIFLPYNPEEQREDEEGSPVMTYSWNGKNVSDMGAKVVCALQEKSKEGMSWVSR